jgi:hypothetical protein
MKIEVPNVDLNTVETGIPLLPEGRYLVRIDGFEKKPSKDGQSENLNIKYTLSEPAKTIGGEDVAPGFPIFDLISLKVTDKYNPAKRLAAIMDCFAERASAFETEDLLGKEGLVQLRIRTSEEYGDKNEVKNYIPQ